MISPQSLHGIAAVWSLAAVWPALADAAEKARGAFGGDRGTVQAWRPGTGRHRGTGSDRILDAVLQGQGAGQNPYAARLHQSGQTVAWVAAAVVPSAAGGTLEVLHQLRAALVTARPAAALNVALWIGAEARAVRKLLGEADDRVPLARINCPGCDLGGSLALRTGNPVQAERPVICTADCTCTGDGCPCGMGATAEHLPHIWTQEQFAAALDAADARRPAARRPVARGGMR